MKLDKNFKNEDKYYDSMAEKICSFADGWSTYPVTSSGLLISISVELKRMYMQGLIESKNETKL